MSNRSLIENVARASELLVLRTHAKRCEICSRFICRGGNIWCGEKREGIDWPACEIRQNGERRFTRGLLFGDRLATAKNWGGKCVAFARERCSGSRSLVCDIELCLEIRDP